MSDLTWDNKQLARKIAKAVKAADEERLQARKRRARKAADEAYRREMAKEDDEDEDPIARAKETPADKLRIQAQRRKQQEADIARRQAQRAPPPDEDGLMAQSTPKDEDVDGRSSCAKALKAAFRKGPTGNEIERHFSAAEQNNMVKTLADTEVEMRQTAHTESYLGNHVSLSDPYGDTLRKGGAPISTAMDTLRKLRSGYLFEQMATLRRLRPGELQKALGVTTSRRSNTLLVKGTDGITRELVLGTSTPNLPTVAAIRKALQRPQPYDPNTFFKGTDLPPENADSEDNDEIADTGGERPDWSNQGETVSAVRADLFIGREHAAAQHQVGRGRTAVTAEEAERVGGSSRERSVRRPTVPPPGTATPYRGNDPNADDKQEQVQAIKEAQRRHPKPLWGE
jgi:hypothetical protein